VIRVGIGYDSHRFAAGRPLVLGGVTIPHDLGLTGHSDADAVVHALIDALLGAAGLGDIGTHYPDTDPAWKDANSLLLLPQVVAGLGSNGWRPLQCDITVIAERPKLAPHAAAIRERLAGALGVSAGAVGFKAKTNEGMGFIGRGEGIAAMAVATLGPLDGPG
jgi:2-C-methyl-D-erythritol 2,4-cyclodiphosphate synthase